MDRWPATNNVYGYLYSNTSLEKIAKVLRTWLGLSPDEAYAFRSQDDGYEVLRLRTESFEFETQRIKEGGAWFFNGIVAGDRSTVISQVQYLSDVLRWAGYSTQFEIYDSDFNCIAEIRKSAYF